MTGQDQSEWAVNLVRNTHSDRKVAESPAGYGALERYALAFARLRVNRRNAHVSPHKPRMLLAVIDLAAAGDLVVNEIRYERARAGFAIGMSA